MPVDEISFSCCNLSHVREPSVISGINLGCDPSREFSVYPCQGIHLYDLECFDTLEQNKDIFIHVGSLFILSAVQLYTSGMEVYILYEIPLYSL